MRGCLAKGNDVYIVSALCVGHVRDLPEQLTKEIDSHLAVGHTIIFLSDDWPIEDTLASGEIKRKLLDVNLSL